MEKKINGLKLNYIVQGEGKNILVLHGWGAEINTVKSIVDTLQDKGRVYALDLPGFGASDEPLEPIDSFEYAKLVKEFIDSEGIEKISLIGHSFGGKISIILASKFPDLVEKLVLIDSAGLIPKRGLKYHIKVKTFKFLKLMYSKLLIHKRREDRLRGLYKRFGSDDYQDSSGVMRQILVRVVNESLEDELREIKAPTLIIWGAKDQATPLYQAEHMEKLIADSGLVVFDQAGHYAYLDDYNRFRAVIRAFF